MKLLIFLSLILAAIAASIPDFGEENNEEFPDVIFLLWNFNWAFTGATIVLANRYGVGHRRVDLAIWNDFGSGRFVNTCDVVKSSNSSIQQFEWIYSLSDTIWAAEDSPGFQNPSESISSPSCCAKQLTLRLWSVARPPVQLSSLQNTAKLLLSSLLWTLQPVSLPACLSALLQSIHGTSWLQNSATKK